MYVPDVVELERSLVPFKAGRQALWRGGWLQHPQSMSISAAVTEIQSAALSARQLRYRRFRAQQHALDELIDEVESVVREGVRTLPGELRRRAELTLARVHGQVPPWLARVTEPTRLLDELFIAEGRLRQQYYVGVRLELEDSA